jgi:hypothetical protein
MLLRAEEIRYYFLFFHEGNLIQCDNVDSLTEALGKQHDPHEWQLFMVSWKLSYVAPW